MNILNDSIDTLEAECNAQGLFGRVDLLGTQLSLNAEYTQKAKSLLPWSIQRLLNGAIRLTHSNFR